MATRPQAAAPQSQPHVLQHSSPQYKRPQGPSDRTAMKRLIAEQTERQLLCFEALLLLSQNDCPGIDLSALLPSLPKPASPDKASCRVDSDIYSNATCLNAPMQPSMGFPAHAARHPAATAPANPCAPAQLERHATYAGDGFRRSPSQSPAICPAPDRQGAGCSSREVSEPATRHSTPPSQQAHVQKSPADEQIPAPDKCPENSSAMGLRRDRKRNVLSLLDEDPEWAAEVLKKELRYEGSKPWVKCPAGTLPEGLSPDLQNAAQHIEQRRGVYFKLKEKAFEAQLDTARYKKSLKLDIPGPNVWYLGLFRVEPATLEQLRSSQNRATKTVDRSRVKLLEGLLSEKELQKELHFPLKDYQTEQEIEERKGRTMKDYCNFLKHNADARRAQHGGKGVAARRRTNGVISYEARISKHNVGTFGTYASLEEAKYAYDVGAIICKGKDYRLNYPLSTYMMDSVFLPNMHVPEPLKTIIQNHVSGLSETDCKAWLKRVEGYFEEERCPFYEPPHNQYCHRSPSSGWASIVARTTEADQAPSPARQPHYMPDAHGQIYDGHRSAQRQLGVAAAATDPLAPVVYDTTGTAAPATAGAEKGRNDDTSDRIAALLAGTATDRSFM